jgi:hypothetical protein
MLYFFSHNAFLVLRIWFYVFIEGLKESREPVCTPLLTADQAALPYVSA